MEDFRSRRRFLKSAAALVGSTAAAPLISCSRPATAAPSSLVARPSTLSLPGLEQPVNIWSYDGESAGPLLRFKQGEMLDIRFRNELPQPTSVHWHGIRMPNEMDGVGSVTEPGARPGEEFHYRFAMHDAGLYWYHPHMNSEKQIARGMFGAIVVEEANPPFADREIIWTLFDWGLTAEGQIPEDKAFQLWRGFHDYTAHDIITTNGRTAPDIVLKRGERVRLRIVNCSSNRRYALDFGGHDPWIIAWDSHGVEPQRLGDRPLMVGNGVRVDLMLDGVGDPSVPHVISDVFDHAVYDETAAAEPICAIRYDTARLRPDGELERPRPPARNPFTLPDLTSDPERIPIRMTQDLHEVRDIPDIGGIATLLAAEQGVAPDQKVAVWKLNGQVLFEDLRSFQCINPTPLFECKLGRTYILELANDTPTDHPMHLHGHTFQILSKNGRKLPHPMWRDSFTLIKGDRMEVAFCADNPGDWMVHCHRGLHSHGGMMSIFRVT
ncbi:MAG: multicopper oxidase family protein [Hyphomonadaceae bacterium]|nr:multicopper oxidase family protein [Hyphomonadaceae bacterium]